MPAHLPSRHIPCRPYRPDRKALCCALNELPAALPNRPASNCALPAAAPIALVPPSISSSSPPHLPWCPLAPPSCPPSLRLRALPPLAVALLGALGLLSFAPIPLALRDVISPVLLAPLGILVLRISPNLASQKLGFGRKSMPLQSATEDPRFGKQVTPDLPWSHARAAAETGAAPRRGQRSEEKRGGWARWAIQRVTRSVENERDGGVFSASAQQGRRGRGRPSHGNNCLG